jgi:hypothetical protein
MPGVEDKMFIRTSDCVRIFRFVRILRWRLVADPSTFALVTRAIVVVVVDICERATEALNSACAVFLSTSCCRAI